MAITGQQVIRVGLQNESTDSDSLYAAFTKTKTNFATIFACASPYTNFTGNVGIEIVGNAAAGTIDVLNTGVTSIIAGTGIVLDRANGAVTIASTGGGGNGGGTVTSVAATSSTLTITGSPVISAGEIGINLPIIANIAGNYTYPTMTVDQFGRITAVTSAAAAGTVTSVAVTPGYGIQVSGSPVTTTGNIVIVNTGVTRLSAGTGITVSGSNGNVTISSTVSSNPGTVTSVGLTSTTLTVTPTPITTSGTLQVELGANVAVNSKFSLVGSEDLAPSAAASLVLPTSYFTTGAAETATLAAGTNGQIKTFMMVATAGNMVITVANAGWKASGTGTMTFSAIGQGCTLQYTASKWFCIGNNSVVFA